MLMNDFRQCRDDLPLLHSQNIILTDITKSVLSTNDCYVQMLTMVIAISIQVHQKILTYSVGRIFIVSSTNIGYSFFVPALVL